MIKSLETQVLKYNAFEMGKKIASSSGILKHYHEDNSPEAMNRKENIEELLSGLKDFSEMDSDVEGESSVLTLDLFMQDIALLTDSDIKKDDPSDFDKVSLMTIHAAKGLEFPYVYLAGVEENLFPSQLSLNSRADLEEERRLFYVAITRAMARVTISYAETRFRFGQFTICEPSRFIDELADEFTLNTSTHQPFKKQSWTKESFADSRKNFSNQTVASETSDSENGSSMFTSQNPNNLKIGLMVQHQRFGMGKIENIEGQGENAKATVNFSNFGKKQLLLKFAKLKILN